MPEPDADDAGAVTVSLVPAEQSVVAGEQVTLELTVEGADRGVGAFESAVHADDGVTVRHLELTGDPAVPVTDTVDDETAALMAAAMGPESDHTPADEVVLAAVTVCAETPGSTVEIAVEEDTEVAPITDGTEHYTVTGCEGATLTVEPDPDNG